MKTAIVGFGPHGKRIAQVVSKIGNLQLIGIVDSRKEAFEGSTVPIELKFNSIDELYARHQDIPVVLIATNAPSHASLACIAIEHGAKYVMVEKPMACSMAECNAIISTAQINGARLAVDKINRHDPVNQFIRNKIVSGEWGMLRSVYIQKPGIGLGCLGTHSFDLVNYLVGSDPLRVSGWVDKPVGRNPRGDQYKDPGGHVVVEYADGIKGFVSQIEDGAGPQTMEVHLTGARIYHDPKNSVLDIRARDLSVKPGLGKPAVYNQVTIPEEINVKGDMLAQVESVVRELIGTEPMLVDARFGKSAVEILVAAYVSNERGNIPVQLPLTSQEALDLYLSVT